jgi:PAS domain S-box-containing protein
LEDKDKTKKELREELKALRTKIAGLEQAVADLRLAEEELKESEEKFHSISAMAKDAIVMMDNDERISYWNKAARRMFGYTNEEASGKELHRLIVPGRYHKDFSMGFKRFKETGQGRFIGKTLELEAVKKDGTEFPVGLSVSAVKLKGRWKAIGIMRDITDRKGLEAELKEKIDDLERINKLMVGRELKMEALRKEISELRAKVKKFKGR